MTANFEDPHLGLVVEGAGDVPSIPLLLRRHLEDVGEFRDILGKPVPCHGIGNALRPKGIEGKVAVAAARPGCRALLVALDGEYEPVCELGPALTERVAAVVGIPSAICLADPKFEAWLVASAETLNLADVAYPVHGDPAAAIRQALKPAKYVKPTWQPRLTGRMNLPTAMQRSVSLTRLFEKVDSLLPHI